MLKNRIFASLVALTLVAMLLSSCAAPASPSPTVAPSAFLTINVEQQATWVRNFNPFSPDARLQAPRRAPSTSR